MPCWLSGYNCLFKCFLQVESSIPLVVEQKINLVKNVLYSDENAI